MGLNFWISAFDGGFGLDAMAVDFSTQPETLANYPFFENDNPSVAQLGTFIDSVYQNLFNRDPDTPGRDFWAGAIESGAFSVGEAISLIIEGAITWPDKDVVANKVAVGLDFYNDLNAVAPTYEFQQDDVDEATAIQAGVTEDTATIAVAAAQTDTFVANFDDGSTPTDPTGPVVATDLTSGTDLSGGASGGADTQGTAAMDTFAGTVLQNETGSLQSADIIDGGEGTDTLAIRVIDTGTGLAVAPTVRNVEVFEVDNQTTSGNFELNFSGITGQEKVSESNTSFGTETFFSQLDDGVKARLLTKTLKS